MTRFGRMLGLFTVFLLLILTVSGAFAADFGYGDVYWLNETTGQWVKDVDGTWATLKKTEDGDSFSGNTGGASITGSAQVAFEDPGFATLSSFQSLSMLAPTNSYTWVNDPENVIFSITAEALPFDNPLLTDIVWDDNAKEFFLVHRNTVATWQFTYKVTNNSNVPMKSVEVTDNFNGELVILKDSAIVSGAAPTPDIKQKQVSYELSWAWSPDFDFSIAPGKSVELTFLVMTGTNPGGKQQYFENRTYPMHSGGLLKYKPGGKGKVSLEMGEDEKFKVRVYEDPTAPPDFCFEVSCGGVEWYIRKPGDYFTKVLDATVSVTGTTNLGEHMAVEFSGFGDLTLQNSDQKIPVWYSLADEIQPGAWISPRDLNDRTELLYPSEGNNASFSMWQKVDLGTQSSGMYENVGVITFTLVNSQIHHVYPE